MACKISSTFQLPSVVSFARRVGWSSARYKEASTSPSAQTAAEVGITFLGICAYSRTESEAALWKTRGAVGCRSSSPSNNVPASAPALAYGSVNVPRLAQPVLPLLHILIDGELLVSML